VQEPGQDVHDVRNGGQEEDGDVGDFARFGNLSRSDATRGGGRDGPAGRDRPTAGRTAIQGWRRGG
jgi:hypothetical protein